MSSTTLHSSPNFAGLPTAFHVLPWSVEPKSALPSPTWTSVWSKVPSFICAPEPDEMKMKPPFCPNGHPSKAMSFEMSRGFDHVLPLSADSCTRN